MVGKDAIVQRSWSGNKSKAIRNCPVKINIQWRKNQLLANLSKCMLVDALEICL